MSKGREQLRKVTNEVSAATFHPQSFGSSHQWKVASV
jgi:hypothetical protein